MSRIQLNDLPMLQDLTEEQAKGICGGIFFKIKMPKLPVKPTPAKAASKPAAIIHGAGTAALSPPIGNVDTSKLGKIDPAFKNVKETPQFFIS